MCSLSTSSRRPSTGPRRRVLTPPPLTGEGWEGGEAAAVPTPLPLHVITHRRITEAMTRHPEAAGALDQWYRLERKAEPRSFAELRGLFGSVDKVGSYYVFDIGGNKLRLIAATHFNRGKLFVRHVLMHVEYDRGRWKEG